MSYYYLSCAFCFNDIFRSEHGEYEAGARETCDWCKSVNEICIDVQGVYTHVEKPGYEPLEG